MNKDPWTTPTADSHNGKEFWASIVLTEKQIKSNHKILGLIAREESQRLRIEY